MTWQNDDYVVESGGTCPVCGSDGCMLKVRFSGTPAKSLNRPLTDLYTNCSPQCPGGISTNIHAMPPTLARTFLHKLGNPLALEMARLL